MKVFLMKRIAGGLFLFFVCGSASLFTQTGLFAQRAQQRRTQPASISSSPQTVSDLREAASLLESGKLAEAEAILRRILAANPNNFDAHNLLGIVFDQSGKTSAAEREYQSAIRLNRNDISARANLGVLYARTSRSDEAIKTFTEVLRLAPDHPQATLNLGLEYAKRHDDVRAVPLLQRAIALGLDGYEPRYRLGVSLYNLKRYDEAFASLQFAAELSPNASEPLYYLGLIHWSRQQDEPAADLWDRAIQLRPNFPEVNFMLGEALRKNGRTLASIEFYQRALVQDASKFVHYARLGGAHLQLGQADDALEVFSRGLQKFPNLAEAHYFVAIAARARANYELAELELRKSLLLRPRNVDALAQLGFIVGERERFAEAERLLRSAIAIDARHFYANYDLGRLLVKSKRYVESLPILQHAATLKPKNPSVHYQLFIAFSRLKRKDEANAELAIFKRLEEARKAQPQQIDENEIENPDAPAPERKPDR